ncbi:AraC family transcriptional regulator [Actinosynnema pretiosum]|uniref:AraC family transcriptional regulator n=1 Tax=Actinosynnema pretiosum TaxID=42197 RepID=A0A290Z1F2_9PSEU|nr:AraC family transcriptional regulator [Actinosynnema pretiosum]
MGRVYRERRAHSGLRCVWRREVDAGAVGGQVRVVPDGCTDLLFSPGDGRLFVAGPDTRAHLSAGSGALHAVRFPPGVGPSVFGVPGAELRDRRVPLDALWGPVDALLDRLLTAADPEVVLARESVRRLRESPPDPVARVIAATVARPGGVAGLADGIGLSERQLRRRSAAAFGYGPKVLQRVLRFDRAVALARAGTGFAETAARTGYADQAHLSREVRELAGVPLGVLVGR